MYSQDEKDGMAMKNATIDKFASKKGCPEGQVPDGKGGCMDKPKTGMFDMLSNIWTGPFKEGPAYKQAKADKEKGQENISAYAKKIAAQREAGIKKAKAEKEAALAKAKKKN